MKFATVEQPPAVLSFQIGDGAHNLRFTLDHLMYLLARPCRPVEASHVQFPLAPTGENFARSNWRMPGVAPEVRTTVELFQPYNVELWPETALLGQLQAMNNWDKHRSRLTTLVAVRGSQIKVRGAHSITTMKHEYLEFFGPLEPGTTVTRFGMMNIEMQYRGEVVSPELMLGLVFNESMPEEIGGAPVITTLKRIS